MMKIYFPKFFLVLFLMCSFIFSQGTTAQCTITGTVNAGTLTCGTTPISACNGFVYIGNGVTASSLVMNTALNLTCLGPIQLIVTNNANINFSAGNDYLTLAEGSSVTFQTGSNLIGGSCNASERLYIGTNLLASCNGNAGADVSFTELVTLGGTGSAAANSPVCVGNSINLTATPPPNGTYTFSWSGNGLSPTTYSSSPNYTVSATVSGTYQVKMKTSLMASPMIAEISVVVTSGPSAPTIGTITQPTCAAPTGSIALSGLPSSGTWTLTRSGTSSGTTTGTGTTTTVSGLAAGTYTFTVNNGSCTSSSSSNAVVTAVASTTWNGTSWSNGTPTSSMVMIFNGNYTANANLDACSCQINSGNIVINPGFALTLNEGITVSGGSLTIENNASLIQTDNSAVNTGNVIVKRDVNVKKFDYVYWASPVAGFALPNVSPSTSTAHLWKWLPTVGGNYGNWSNTSETMTAGKGYIVRGPSTYGNVSAQLYTSTFSGIANNGVINATIERGSYQGANYTTGSGGIVTKFDDNNNLVGNPYPSSIKALDFLTVNTNIDGAIRLWTHGTLPSTSAANPFYGSFVYNYTVNDYIIYNGIGTLSGPAGFNGYIASGQGFFVTMNDGAATTATVTFNNSMRSKTYSNSQFYRTAQTTNDASSRIWLDLVAANGTVNRTLIGYTEAATYAKDRLYDCNIQPDNNQSFYTLIEQEKVCIQGRPSFDPNDIVPIGFTAPTAAAYNIAIGAVDGLFENNGQPIFLKDNLLDIVHDLRVSPYAFSTNAGTFDNRFVLVYSNTTLAVANSFGQNEIGIVNDAGTIKINSLAGAIDKINTYDLLGRNLYSKANVSNSTFEISDLDSAHQVLILKIELENGTTVTKKIDY
jgi:hypothetical protein